MKCRETSFEGEGFCKNLVELSIYDGPMETVEYFSVNIWSMLNWNVEFCHTVDHSGIHLID